MAPVTKKKGEQGGKEKGTGEKGEFLRRIKELGKISKETYNKIPDKLIQKYSETVKKHETQRKERDELLNQVKEELHAKWRKPATGKQDKQSAKKDNKQKQIVKLDNPGHGDDCQVVMPNGCESEFDTTVLSLTNRRSKFLQHFHKLLIFNHPFKNSFVKNNWFIGQVLRYRQEWRPAGFGLGELIRSFSLLPLEETTIELTVWEKTVQATYS
jgi:hypothetical protein